MKFEISTIPACEQRYDTVGDWYAVKRLTGPVPQDITMIAVTDVGDRDSEFLVAIHELVEAFLCQRNGISQSVVDHYDTSSTADEPGDTADCPYRNEHIIAMKVERLLADEMGVDFDAHEKRLNEVHK